MEIKDRLWKTRETPKSDSTKQIFSDVKKDFGVKVTIYLPFQEKSKNGCDIVNIMFIQKEKDELKIKNEDKLAPSRFGEVFYFKLTKNNPTLKYLHKFLFVQQLNCATKKVIHYFRELMWPWNTRNWVT